MWFRIAGRGACACPVRLAGPGGRVAGCVAERAAVRVLRWCCVLAAMRFVRYALLYALVSAFPPAGRGLARGRLPRKKSRCERVLRLKKLKVKFFETQNFLRALGARFRASFRGLPWLKIFLRFLAPRLAACLG